MYLEVLKSLSELQISPAWTVDAECDSSEPHSCSGLRHAEKWPNNLRGRWAHLFSEFSETQYVYPLIEQTCNSSSWWPTVSGGSSLALGINRHYTNDFVYLLIRGLVPRGALREHHGAHMCMDACAYGYLRVFLLWYEALVPKPSRHKQNRKCIQMRQ